MSTNEKTKSGLLHRRAILKAGVASLPVMAWRGRSTQAGTTPADARKPTQFQIACMTLPYSQFPLERALKGIQSAGYSHVAWGTTHREKDGKEVPVIAPDAPAAKAKELADRCRDLGLVPLMMFSGIYPEAKNAVEILTNRIRQASAGGLP